MKIKSKNNKEYKNTCKHSYVLSVPYSQEGKKTTKEYYKGKKGRYICHYECIKCNDRTIAWNDIKPTL